MSAPAVVLGDGTTTASRTRAGWRRRRWVLLVVVVLAIGVLAAVLPTPRTSLDPLAPDNAQATGARAVAQVLGDQGVQVEYVRTTADATAAARAGTTLLVTSDYLLTADQVQAVAATEADLVLLDTTDLLAEVTDDLSPAWSGTASPSRVDAACADADAEAAGTISAAGAGYTAVEGDQVRSLCFPVPGSQPTAYLYATVTVDDRTVTVLGDPGLLTNDRVDDEGNAALVLRALGQGDTLVWYLPSPDDTGTTTASGTDAGSVLPPQATAVALLALVVVAALALWRGRRLGRVVAEPLPVVVRSAETTLGRARLYRAARAYGHAAASLRAGTTDRCARRVGLPASAGPAAVCAALAHATGRSEEAVADLLYGPPPTDDPGLQRLARQLDELESEVNRS